MPPICFTGRMGKGTGKANESIRKGNANETETRRPKCAHAEASAGEGGLGEKYDVTEGQEERVTYKEDART